MTYDELQCAGFRQKCSAIRLLGALNSNSMMQLLSEWNAINCLLYVGETVFEQLLGALQPLGATPGKKIKIGATLYIALAWCNSWVQHRLWVQLIAGATSG